MADLKSLRSLINPFEYALYGIPVCFGLQYLFKCSFRCHLFQLADFVPKDPACTSVIDSDVGKRSYPAKAIIRGLAESGIPRSTALSTARSLSAVRTMRSSMAPLLSLTACLNRISVTVWSTEPENVRFSC